MPQTSPMNWLIISISLFILFNLMTMKISNPSSNSMKMQKKMKKMNLIWKW